MHHHRASSLAQQQQQRWPHRTFATARRASFSRMAAAARAAAKEDCAYDVAIVGGGPAGLLTAHALAAASRGAARVAVFERVPALSPRGAGLGLMANGLEAIAAISEPLFDAIMSRGERGGRARMHAIGGAVQGEVDLNTAPEAGAMTANGRRGRVFWAWSDLQALFADTLPRDGGNGGGCVELRLGEKLEAIEEVDNGSGVALRFANRDAPVTAAVAVGADGYFSKVRALTVADGPPQDMQTVFWRARIPESAVRAAGVDPGGDGLTQQFMGDGLVFLLMPVTSGDYTWAGSCPVSLLREAGVEWPPEAAAAAAKGGDQEDATKLSVLGSASAMDAEERRALGAAAKERMLAAFAPLAPPMRALVAATDPAVVVEHGLYIRPAERMTEAAFGAGRVAIVGDAAHPVRPTGQGFNLAAEDAYFLAAKLAEAADGKGGKDGRRWLDGVDVCSALDAFRAVRLPRVKAIMADAQERGARAYKRDGGQQQQPADGGKRKEQEQLKEEPQKQKQLQDWQKDWAEFVFGIKLAPLGAEVVARV